MLKTIFWKYQRAKTRASFKLLELGFKGEDVGEDSEFVEDEFGVGKWDLGLKSNGD